MSRVDFDIVVVGAGLSGLTAAFRLVLQGWRVAVLEAAARPGGVIGSMRRDGALYELGPNSGMDTSPLVNQLLRDAGILDQRIEAQAAAARRYVIRGGRPVALPASAGAFLTSSLFSWRAKLGLLREPFVPAWPAQAPEQSVASFVRRRLGPQFLDYAVEPFVAGIYAGDPEQLSLRAAFPRLHALERDYGGLLRGALFGARARRLERERSGQSPKHRAGSFSFRNGMQTLTDALARHVGRVECGVLVQSVERAADGCFVVTGSARDAGALALRARAVILAVPAGAAARLLAVPAAQLPAVRGAVDALEAIVYPPLATVASLFRRRDVRHRLDGFGVLAPRTEAPAVLGTLFSSSMFAHRTDAAHVLLTSFAGGRRDPQIALAPATAIAARVQTALTHYLGAEEPLWHEVTVWPQAIPQYDFGHLERMARVAAAETALPGLYFCANYRDGVSISDCVQNGHAMGERVGRLLASAVAAPAAALQSAALATAA